MKNNKTISLGFIILSLNITSCVFSGSQQSTSSFSSIIQSNIDSSSNVIQSSETTKLSYNLKTIDEMVMSYFDTVKFGATDVPETTTVLGLYNCFKQNKERWTLYKQNKVVYNLSSEDKIRCYYVKKDVRDAITKVLNTVGVSDSLLPWRGLTAYLYARNNGNGSIYLSKELANQPIMEVVLSDETDCVDVMVDGYYLLDIIRYYNDLDFGNFRFVDFVPFENNNNFITIKTNELKKAFKGFDASWIKREVRSANIGYHFFPDIDYICSEITIKDNIEVVEQTFEYNSYLDDTDQHYFDDLDECVIKKTPIVSELNFNKEKYNIIFDYQKLMTLFGFNLDE